MRWVMLVVTSVVICLVMVLVITWRIDGPSNELELNARWGVLLLKEAPAAMTAKDIWGVNPPDIVKHMAVAWDKADVLSWWWLPLLFIGIRLIVGSYARRRSRI